MINAECPGVDCMPECPHAVRLGWQPRHGKILHGTLGGNLTDDCKPVCSNDSQHSTLQYTVTAYQLHVTFTGLQLSTIIQWCCQELMVRGQRQRLVVWRQGLVVQGQAQKLVNWSSRILEDKDFPRGQQNSNYHYCSVPKVSHTTPNGRPSSVNVQSPNRHHLLISKSWSLFSCTCSSSVVTNSITLIFLSQNQESLIFICITLPLESTPCFIPSSHILTISLHSPRLTCSIITTLTTHLDSPVPSLPLSPSITSTLTNPPNRRPSPTHRTAFTDSGLLNGSVLVFPLCS